MIGFAVLGGAPLRRTRLRKVGEMSPFGAMRGCRSSTKLEGMDTLLSLCPLVVALIPLVMALRALMTAKRPQSGSPVATFYARDGNPSTFPSLATLKEMEDTAPLFVKRNEWWAE